MAGKIKRVYRIAKAVKKVRDTDKTGIGKTALKTGLKLLPGGRLSTLGGMWALSKIALKAMAVWQMHKHPPPPRVAELRAAGKKRERAPRRPR